VLTCSGERFSNGQRTGEKVLVAKIGEVPPW